MRQSRFGIMLLKVGTVDSLVEEVGLTGFPWRLGKVSITIWIIRAWVGWIVWLLVDNLSKDFEWHCTWLGYFYRSTRKSFMRRLFTQRWQDKI